MNRYIRGLYFVGSRWGTDNIEWYVMDGRMMEGCWRGGGGGVLV